MPTTATVAAAPRRYTAEDIASGLRAFADIIDAKPELAESIRFPNVPQHISFGVTDPADVEAFAVIFDTAVEEADNGDHTYLSATGQLDALRVSAYAVTDRVRVFHRDPEATAILAERDA